MLRIKPQKILLEMYFNCSTWAWRFFKLIVLICIILAWIFMELKGFLNKIVCFCLVFAQFFNAMQKKDNLKKYIKDKQTKFQNIQYISCIWIFELLNNLEKLFIVLLLFKSNWISFRSMGDISQNFDDVRFSFLYKML